MDPDREVAINTDRQSSLVTGRRGGRELTVGFPLQKLNELDALKSTKQRFQYRAFAGSDRAVINDRDRARGVPGRRKPLSSDQCAQGLVFSETGDQSHVDVQIIQPASARR